MLSEEEFKDLNNEVVVPAYRQFCRENGLEFHFWDELPPGCFNLKTANREFGMHKEAMELFNKLKPQFHVFRNYVVTFQLTSWGLDFSYHAEPLDVFLSKHSELVETAGRSRMLYDALVVIAQLATIGILVAIKPQWLGGGWGMVALVGCLIVGWYPCKQLIHVLPDKKKQKKAEEFRMRLEQLRAQLKYHRASAD
ncbi:MAG: hypothetical protein AAB370_03090 [Verrucomicrobiota bacterium]